VWSTAFAWRAYADDGRGYALGFETAALEGAFCRRKGKPIPQHSTFPMTYDDAELTRIQTALVDLIDPLISLRAIYGPQLRRLRPCLSFA
jgi:hypothetical protein